MQRIPLHLAAPSMVLAKPVQRSDGMVLLAESTELTSAHITRLESMNVESIVVEGAPVDFDGDMSLTTRTKDDLDRLFRKHTDNEFMMKLKGHLTEYFQVRGMAAASNEDEDDGSAS